MQTLSTSVSSMVTAAAGTGQATGITSLSWLLVALPLLGAAVLLLGGRRTDKFGPLLATGAVLGELRRRGALVFLAMLGRARPTERAESLHLYSWVPAGAFQLEAGLLIDPLSVAFVLLVTFVGSLIHVYSLGYMEHDPDKRRFFAYLNLFVASMLLLVLADSYLLLYVGWEGVGLASYLLIGFWNHNPAFASAANKAFVANRVGDFGLSHRDHADVRDLRPGRLRRRQRGRPGHEHGGPDRHGPAAAARRLRQVRAVPAAELAG